MIVGITLVLLLVLANGFFVAAEFALVKVRTSQIDLLARRGNWAAKLARSLLEHLDAYLSACQLGITLASLALGWIGEPVVTRLLQPCVELVGLPAVTAEYIALPLAFVTITFLHITLGQQAPKVLAIQTARRTTLTVALPLLVFFHVFRPFIWLLNVSSNLMLRVVGIRVVSEHERTHTEDELRLILMESAAGGTLSRRERLMMENVLDLENKIARQIMVPRRDIVYLNTRSSLEENVRLVSRSGHTRFPVCDGDLDRVVGMVHSKDLLRSVLTGKPITRMTQLARRVPFLPETLRLDLLLLEFQRNHTHLAMLVDEYGVVSGMVTLENVLEQLVGPIQDEFDRELPQVIARGNGRYLVDARCPLEDLVERCEVEVPAELDTDTTGGLVVELLGHIPRPGEKVRVGRHELTVLETEPTRVRRVEVVALEPEPGPVQEQADLPAEHPAKFP